ncbi:MAG: hypothetical protein ABJ327_01890 [Litoreibacter sp.]
MTATDPTQMDLTAAKDRIEAVLFDAVQTEEEVQVASCLLGMMRCGGVEDLLAHEKAQKDATK